ncbi:ribonuclease HI [Roseivirga misakiensis]|uniref:ribonuclease H n=1 Tax=Roseivirga misakiensis TaxID=1563681 RepID=A0A1E5SYH4_9BACT|nr:ribonuclease HI [Roseivirga misakiensis]OEK04087.1 ribonuclease HI [Roseivirga misakiensis]
MIVIYTDGSSRGNPGPGGYGAVMKYKEHRKELSQGYRKTTNNRMELLAVIIGLESLKVEQAKVKVYSDSKYVIDSVEKGWLWNWIKKDFKGKKNKDLWLRFAEVYKKHRVTFQWVKGHAGIEENERCDQLAVEAADGGNHLIDEGFESGLYS